MKRRSPKYVCYCLVGKLKLEKTLHHCHEVLNDLTGFELYIVLCKFLFSNVTTEYFYLSLIFRMIDVDTSFCRHIRRVRWHYTLHYFSIDIYFTPSTILLLTNYLNLMA